MYPKELAKLLEKEGFNALRQVGSHRTYAKGEIKITVAMNNREIKRRNIKLNFKKSGT